MKRTRRYISRVVRTETRAAVLADVEGMEDLARGHVTYTDEELDLGDLTAHHGWTLHWSPPQPEIRSALRAEHVISRTAREE